MIGIAGITQNPSTRKSSHNAGWTMVLKAMIESQYPNERVSILTEKDEWNLCRIIYLNEGVNFKGQFNLFGGVSDKLKKRLKKLNNYPGILKVWGHDVPDYDGLVAKRGIGLGEIFFQGLIYQEKTITPHDNIVIGDSHSISVWEPGYQISRNDGKTLHGAIKDGTILEAASGYRKVRLYFGNIDIRHHVCRYEYSIIGMLAKKYINVAKELQEKGCEVEFVALLLPETEDRKIPKTGHYKGTPFYGSKEERREKVHIFNELLRHSGFRVLEWGERLQTEGGFLSTTAMEARQSVHLAPHSYMFKDKFVS